MPREIVLLLTFVAWTSSVLAGEAVVRETTLTTEKVARSHRAVNLENDCLRMIVLPELDGKTYAAHDKTNNHCDFIYCNHVIKSVRIEKDVAYLGADRQEKGDLYLPMASPEGRLSPAVVIIHGGGWTGGDKAAAREINIGTTLAANGYVGFSINYLLAKGRPVWPQNLYDCKTAVRWLRKNAERLKIDPRYIGVIGGSAGGHLAAMVALTDSKSRFTPPGPYGEYSCCVQAAVDLYGPADLTNLFLGGRPDLAMLPGTLAENPKLYRLASPVAHADKTDPPILILHGTADETVPVEQSRQFVEALKQSGVQHELIVIEGAPHSFHLQPKQRDLRPVVLSFFDRHLKPRQP